MNVEASVQPAGGAASHRLQFLSDANADQLAAAIMVLAAEVESLHEWRITATAAMNEAGIDFESLVEQARVDPHVIEARAAQRRALVARLLDAALPEPDPARPVQRRSPDA